MKLVIQRVKYAKVEVDGKIVGNIQRGFLVLLGVTHNDTMENADYLVKKVLDAPNQKKINEKKEKKAVKEFIETELGKLLKKG